TPHVTGVVALVRSLHPEDWSFEDVKHQVLETVDVVHGAALTYTGGRLNAAVAVGNAPVDIVGPRLLSSDPADVTTGPIDHVRLQFNEAIDPAPIDMDNV